MKSPVSIERVKNYNREDITAGLKNLVNNLGGLKAIIPADVKKVLIKPNLMCGEKWDTGITVNIDLLVGLVKMLRELNIPFVVGEGAGWGVSSQEAFEGTGAAAQLQEIGIEIIDFKQDKGVQVKIPGGELLKTLWVHEVVRDADFIISLAKIKTHCETIASFSMKNMKGIVTQDKERLKFHLLNVNRCLVDMNRVFKPHLSIVEGLIALEGIGPLQPGKPKDLGLLIAGTDPVATDAVCSRIIRMQPEDIRHIKLAAETGLGTIDFDKIEIVGQTLENVIPEHFQKPPRSIEGLSPYSQIQVIPGNPCSNCVAGLASYLHGYLPKEKVAQAVSQVEILIGAKAKSKMTGREIAIGNCLKRYKGKLPFISGCPPPSDSYLDLIEKGLQGKFEVNK